MTAFQPALFGRFSPRAPNHLSYDLLAAPIATLANLRPAALSHLASPRQLATESLSTTQFRLGRQSLCLDGSLSRPTWLQKEEIAQLVLRSIQYASDSL